MKPKSSNLKALTCEDGEEIWALAQELYMTYPHGSARSKLTIKKIEKTLSVNGTMRNWNTLEKMI